MSRRRSSTPRPAWLDTQTFADISLAEIAAAAGVSKGTLYYYYKNKTDILFDLTNRYLDRQWDELIAWTENKDKDTSVHRLVKYVVERNTASAGMRLHLIHAAMLGRRGAARQAHRPLCRVRAAHRREDRRAHRRRLRRLSHAADPARVRRHDRAGGAAQRQL